MSEQPQPQPKPQWQDEKEREKEREKEAEKRPEEKSWDEKWRRNPLSAAVWACILIWAGIVFLADNLKLLVNFGNPDPWNLILAGAGIIFIIEVIVRALVPAYRRSVTGTLILGLVLLGIGLGGLLGLTITWPIILIAIGIALLLRGLLRAR
jgi:hypothetical protein